jgi:hypothetical protein
MKTNGGLNPADKDTTLNNTKEMLWQFLWGSPKTRYF